MVNGIFEHRLQRQAGNLYAGTVIADLPFGAQPIPKPKLIQKSELSFPGGSDCGWTVAAAIIGLPDGARSLDEAPRQFGWRSIAPRGADPAGDGPQFSAAGSVTKAMRMMPAFCAAAITCVTRS